MGDKAKRQLIRAATKGRGMRVRDISELNSIDDEPMPSWPGLVEQQIAKAIEFWSEKF